MEKHKLRMGKSRQWVLSHVETQKEDRRPGYLGKSYCRTVGKD